MVLDVVRTMFTTDGASDDASDGARFADAVRSVAGKCRAGLGTGFRFTVLVVKAGAVLVHVPWLHSDPEEQRHG